MVHNLRQGQLAEGLGLSQSTVSKWFTRGNAPTKKNIDAVIAFCRQYDPAVTYDELFGSEAA